MPISLSDTQRLKAQLQRESDPNGVYASFDAAERRAKLQLADDEEDEEDEEVLFTQEEIEAAQAAGSEDEEDEDGEDAEGEEDDEEDDLSPEERAAIEAELIASVRAERRAAAEAKEAKRSEKREEARVQQEHSMAINFAKRLAHQEKKVRDASIKSLRRWLLRRTTLDEHDLMKIWKGLFYCFWMSDKVPIQQQLAESLSDLLLPPLEFNRSMIIFSTCLITLRREWTAIDQLRMDKFMSLARRFIQKSLMAVQVTEWSKENVEALANIILDSEVVEPNTTARGFAFHFIDCFLTEVERVSAAQPKQPITFEAFNTLLTPFYHILARSHDRTIVERVQKEVFDPILEICSTPLVEEEKPAKKKRGKKSKAAEEKTEEAEEEEQLPQAEGIDSVFPSLHQVLNGQAHKISEVLFAMASDSEILPRSRKLLYTYRSHFDEITAHENDAPIVELMEDPVEETAPVPSKKQGKKRKAESELTSEEAAAVAGVWEGLSVLARERSKKLNKKQRLATKRRKKEALLGEPELPPQASEAEQDEDGDIQMDEGDAIEDDNGGGDADDGDEDMDMDGDEQDPEEYDVEEEEVVLPTPTISKREQRRLDQHLAQMKQEKEDKAKKGKKRHIVPEEVIEEAEEEEPVNIIEPKRKKQKMVEKTPEPVAAAPSAAKAATPKSAMKSSKQPTPVTPAPVSAPAPTTKSPSSKSVAVLTKSQSPASPVQQPTTPTKSTKSITSPSTTVPAGPAQVTAFSTPQMKSTLSHTTATTVRPTAASTAAPPSSSKKNVRIVLSNNQVKQFKKWSRDSITTHTTALLAKPSPKSAIKPTSMEFFYQHNKNGRELAARQNLLARELSNAAKEEEEGESTPTKKKGTTKQNATPPTSPRPKAADFFFQQ